ncbi:MAG TPA: gephyrin-like molybdotransferase Glp [Thermoanaerobaculia bacterium]|nr:gephyrin-like molybdotransferase Glp [Thermoanaerobaculia bacterium]
MVTRTDGPAAASTIGVVIGVDEAFAIVDAAMTALPEERLALAAAAGRVLAADVVADVDWPPFDTSAMDGYAVRAHEARAAEGEAALRERSGLVAAGDPSPPALVSGEAVRVMTGAPLPSGADAVVPLEHSRRDGGRVFFDPVPKNGAHVRHRGESVARGQVLLRAGDRLGPAAVALAALAGADPISVRRRPRVAIAATGNELVPSGEKPTEGKLRDSNGPMLDALCRARGWPTVLRERIADEEAAVEKLFGEFDDADVLVTTGGVSAGDLDLLPPAALRAGWEILFHRVAIRPGKPIAFARRAGRFWFGLPGNPVSASVGFHLFVRRGLDRMEGVVPAGAPVFAAQLARGLPRQGPRDTYRDARLTEESGVRRVEPLATAGSHDIAAHARANALIRIPANAGPLDEGSVVTCVLLDR